MTIYWPDDLLAAGLCAGIVAAMLLTWRQPRRPLGVRPTRRFLLMLRLAGAPAMALFSYRAFDFARLASDPAPVAGHASAAGLAVSATILWGFCVNLGLRT